jgi:hypothetical protein
MIKVLLLTDDGTDSDTIAGNGIGDFVFTNGFADGTVIKMYEDGGYSPASPTTILNFLTGSGVGTDITNATDGTPVATLKIAAGTTDFWQALAAPQDISLFKAVDTLAGGTFNFGLTVDSPPPDLAIALESNGFGISTTITGALTTHDVIGNGSLLEPDSAASAGWDTQSNAFLKFNAVPEPGTCVMWALLMSCGLAFVRRTGRQS